MKQNKNKLCEIKLIAFVTISLFVSCKNHNANKDDLLLAAILLNSGGKAEFRISNTGALAAARIQAGSSQFKVGSHTSGFLTDLAGDNPQNYGDGAGDGFNDHFITPAAVSIGICQVLAYKSVAKGGPEKGKETLENANFVMFKAPGAPVPGSKVCETGFMPIGLQTEGTSSSSAFLPISPIPAEEKQDYDRVGIIARDFTYYFDPKDVPENTYRYVDLVLNNPTSNSAPIDTVGRGDVSPKLFSKDCPVSFINSPSFIFSKLLKPEEMGGVCKMGELAIDSSSGGILQLGGGSDDYNAFTKPDRTLNPPSIASVPWNSNAQKLKFKVPPSVNNLDVKDPYILIVNLDSFVKDSSKKKGDLLFNVSIDNALFWDSNAADNVFSPQLNVADRPNATSGEDNLVTSTRKNLIFHLPTILSEMK
ncbi:sigma factor sigX-regulated lipoprotein SrpA [Leptospira weilii]|uniref:sigma factor sigX-regulated lipoprotein SrpA n=1 Tax=Leptospira weilii TaxID=28184 RepID=UPI001E55F8D2|nr:hypothetical protein [Leptospira weilii]